VVVEEAGLDAFVIAAASPLRVIALGLTVGILVAGISA